MDSIEKIESDIVSNYKKYKDRSGEFRRRADKLEVVNIPRQYIPPTTMAWLVKKFHWPGPPSSVVPFVMGSALKAEFDRRLRKELRERGISQEDWILQRGTTSYKF